MTDSFGTRLRRQRERRQVSLADIAAHTKIKASLFEELERDDASHWPSGIFRRSFVRALWLERKQGYDRSDCTLPSDVFDRPNPNLGIPPFVTREFFAELSDRVWAVFDKEIEEIAKA